MSAAGARVARGGTGGRPAPGWSDDTPVAVPGRRVARVVVSSAVRCTRTANCSDISRKRLVCGRCSALAGDSSGGGLCVQAALRIRDLGLPAPAALLLMSAWVDMELTAPTFESNAATDVFFTREMVQGLVSAYLQNGESPKDPLVNALYADLTDLPPVYLQVGADESGLDDSRRLAEQAREARVEVRLDVFEGQPHTVQMAAGRTPEADDAIRRFAAWVRPKLGL